MPKLQRLKLYFKVRRREGGGFDIGLENLASLTHVTVDFGCDGARMKEVEDVEYKVRDALDMHPNHPTLELSRAVRGKVIDRITGKLMLTYSWLFLSSDVSALPFAVMKTGSI